MLRSGETASGRCVESVTRLSDGYGVPERVRVDILGMDLGTVDVLLDALAERLVVEM